MTQTNDISETHSSPELSGQTVRDKILAFEEEIKNQPEAFIGDSVHCPLKHTFTDGIYTREIFIPAGTFISGKIHKHEHPNFLMKGIVEVVTETGGQERIEAPCSMVSPAGTKRALFAVTDLVWITVHHNPTNTQDMEKLEEIVIAKDYEAYELFAKKQNKISFFQKIKRRLL